MLQNGSRVRGHYDGIPFEGYIYELNHISTVIPDRAIVNESGYHDRLYMYRTIAEYRKGNRSDDSWFEESPEPPIGYETHVQPMDPKLEKQVADEFKHTLSQFRESLIRQHTTYQTVKKAVTCEYGHKHMVDSRIPVKPDLDPQTTNLAYFWYCLAEYQRYTERITLNRQNAVWGSLARKLSIGGGAFIHGSERIKQDWQGLDTDTVKRIKAELDQQYELMCDDYMLAIFGNNLPEALRSYSPERRNRLMARLKAEE